MPTTSPLVRILAGAVTVVLLSAGCASRPPARDASPEYTAPQQGVVTAEDLDRAPTQPIEQVLMARVPGIIATRTPGGGIAIRIRGATSVEGRQTPLYVIDGIPIEPGPYGALTGVNPYDIESIEVLRDAASTTMYGVRGANGVILIKTKSPPPTP